MAAKITCNISVQMVGGPAITNSLSMMVDAIDMIDSLPVPDKAAGEAISVQPGEVGQVNFLLIKASKWGDKLSYSVDAAELDETKRIKLDTSLQIFLGTGSVGLYGKAPKTLFFYNELGEDANVTIFAGRKATVS
jgi:hypothetical protein